MDVHDRSRNSTMVDVRLFKIIGLYQILNPAAGKGHRQRTVMLTFMCLIFGLQTVQIARAYAAINDIQVFVFQLVVVIYTFLCLFKGYVIVANANVLCDVLDVARYSFTSCGHRHPDALRECRNMLRTLLRTFLGFSYVTLISWLVFPENQTQTAEQSDVDDTESTYLSWIFALDTATLTFNMFCWLLFDSYMITVCYALNTQFRVLTACYETIGWRTRSIDSINGSDETMCDGHDQLISQIKDNQKIIKKLDDFFDVIQPLIFVQISTSINTIVGLVFLVLLSYLMGMSILSGSMLKLIAGLLSMAFELFMYCYAFNHVEVAKSAVNFGLYSSDWTEQNVKFKKTVLFAMTMNSSHKRIMKISPKSIINLEMFIRVMNMSYSIVSVLLNSRR